MKILKSISCLCLIWGLLVFMTGCPQTAVKTETPGKVYYTFFDTVSYIYNYAGDSQEAFDEKTAAAADSKNVEGETAGLVAMYSDIAACVVAEGKIIAALNDAIQPKIDANADGTLVAQEFKGTKREQKSIYGMEGKVDNNGDGVMKEWFEQSKAFSEYAVGMTATEIAGMQTKEANAHQISVDEALLSAGCTMQITGICAVVAQAANNAR